MRHLLAASALGLAAFPALAQDGPVKLGIVFGFTGPIESLTPQMAASAELAIKEISDSGLFLDGATLEAVRADSTCIDNAAATAAAERLVTAEGVSAIIGADCSGVTGAILANVAVPNGIMMISPSATSPALSTAEDNGLFFRTAPSDARQGEVIAAILQDRGIGEVAVTYTNNDYGKGLSDSFVQAFTGNGGTVTIAAPHEDGKGDYSAEIAALDAAGGAALAVFGYADQGGKGIIQTAYDSGAFETFVLADGMYSEALLADLGEALEGSFGAAPWTEGEGADIFVTIAEAGGVTETSTFTRESYDAAALIALAMQAAGGSNSAAAAAKVFDVANEPGEKILPGELAKALQILKDGGEVDYVGATNVEFVGGGEAAGTYREYNIEGGAFTTVQFR